MNPSFIGLVAATCVLAPALASVAQPPRQASDERAGRRILAIHTSGSIKIDGVLDEPDWGKAPIAGEFVQNEPQEGAPASESTEVRILFDEEYLYIGVAAHDREPSGIIVNDLREDFAGGVANANIDTDLFELVLDTFGDKRNGHQSVGNPAG